MAKTEFQEWLNKRGSSVAWAARELGVTRGYLSMVVNGHAVPSNLLARSIAKLTDDAVPVFVWERT